MIIKYRIILLFCIILFAVSLSGQAEEQIFNYDENIFINNNIFSIYNLKKMNLRFPLTIREDGYLFYSKQKEYRILDNNYDIFFGYVSLFEQQIEADKDSILYYIEMEHDKEHQQDEYNLDFSSWDQQVEGLLLGKTWNHNNYNLKLEFSIELLKGRSLTQRNYSGIAYKDSEDYIIEGLMDGIYSNSSNEDFHGNGYSLNCGMKWEINENNVLELSVDNFYSEINWYNVYTKIAQIDSDNLYIDENGYHHYEPTIQGNYSYNDYMSRLTPNYNFSFRRGRGLIGLVYRNNIYPYLSYKIIKKPVITELGLFSDFLTIKLSTKYLKAKLMSRDIDLFSSPGISGQLSLTLSF